MTKPEVTVARKEKNSTKWCRINYSLFSTAQAQYILLSCILFRQKSTLNSTPQTLLICVWRHLMTFGRYNLSSGLWLPISAVCFFLANLQCKYHMSMNFVLRKIVTSCKLKWAIYNLFNTLNICFVTYIILSFIGLLWCCINTIITLWKVDIMQLCWRAHWTTWRFGLSLQLKPIKPACGGEYYLSSMERLAT